MARPDNSLAFNSSFPTFCLEKKKKNLAENDRMILLGDVSASPGRSVLEKVNSSTLSFCSSTCIGNDAQAWNPKTSTYTKDKQRPEFL
jgi:hypothetical protein